MMDIRNPNNHAKVLATAVPSGRATISLWLATMLKRTRTAGVTMLARTLLPPASPEPKLKAARARTSRTPVDMGASIGLYGEGRNYLHQPPV